MSMKIGRLLICDRCGESVFEEERDPKGDEGWKNGTRFFGRTAGWAAEEEVRISSYKAGLSTKAMCPSCKRLYDETIKEFWSYGKEVD